VNTVSQGVDLDVLGDVIQLLLEIISTIVVKNLPVRAFNCSWGIAFDLLAERKRRIASNPVRNSRIFDCCMS